MKKKNYHVGLWLIVSLVVIIGVSIYLYYFSGDMGKSLIKTIEPGENTSSIEIYFTDLEKTKLMSETLVIRNDSKEAMVEKALHALLLGPKTVECKRIINEKTKLINVNVIEGQETTVTVNLSQEFYLCEVSDRVLASYSIVKTLCSINGINNINILIDGAPVKNGADVEMGTLNLNDVVFDNPVTNKSKIVVNLYFMNSELRLSAEKREIEISDNEQIERVLVDELIKGPNDKNLSQAIRGGTKIKSIETINGVCFVNLTGTIATTSLGTIGEELEIYSIVNTLTEVENIEKVQILIDGQKSMSHIDISEPLLREESLID